MREKYCIKHNKAIMGIWNALELSNGIVDETKPDLILPQIYYAMQTAENIRLRYPDRKDLWEGFVLDIDIESTRAVHS